MLFATLEHRFPRAEILDPQAITGVIALGGGVERIREAGRLARRYPHLRVFVSGESPVYVFKLLGRDIELTRVDIETRSRNTYENAVFAKAALKPRPGDRWLLVTSASHMPRAMGTFRQNSFLVEPWPVYDLRENRLNAVATHEWLGLIAYRLLGRSSELFPTPSKGKSQSTARVTRGAQEEGNYSWLLAAAVRQGD
jgi:uncharacterized SAM-binding protein YcdF (DUF218 family)